ncbi:hypothetical protein IscW_ISCW010496 [Ixodes scapularis]|uniref:RNase H type-1 domain-containing protein n=1 Tax=Ixodes scapularis TaxID=6945 RepID=B7Q6S0_IXOSC|nr:hypothetical protein IscW_ISCW010496 [Ixodes scapularis]|eukprot:XP_002403286.1 hypothetical protein IscW_ISCW010496 [Ixodes scapularis]
MPLPNPKLDLPPLQPDLPHWEDLGDITNTRQLFRNRNSQTLARLTTAQKKMVSTWNDPLHIRLVAYMNAAADDGPEVPLCSAAVVVPELSTSTSRERPSRTTIKGGELEAISLTLDTVLHEHPFIRLCEVRVFEDSQDALTECKRAHRPSRKAKRIKRLTSGLSQRGRDTKILWIPGHAGIKGNEEAHDLARALLPTLRAKMETSQDPQDSDREEEHLRIMENCKLKFCLSLQFATASPPSALPPCPGLRSA